MNLNYDLKKIPGQDMGDLFIFIDKKKLTMSDFLCYMQYEFFCSFFISVLSDICREQYKDFEFPVFKSEDYGNPFKLTIYFNNQKPKVVDNQENFVENYLDKIWNWAEIKDEDIKDICEKENLMSSNKENFDSIVWVCKQKI